MREAIFKGMNYSFDLKLFETFQKTFQKTLINLFRGDAYKCEKPQTFSQMKHNVSKLTLIFMLTVGI